MINCGNLRVKWHKKDHLKWPKNEEQELNGGKAKYIIVPETRKMEQIL